MTSQAYCLGLLAVLVVMGAAETTASWARSEEQLVPEQQLPAGPALGSWHRHDRQLKISTGASQKPPATVTTAAGVLPVWGNPPAPAEVPATVVPVPAGKQQDNKTGQQKPAAAKPSSPSPAATSSASSKASPGPAPASPTPPDGSSSKSNTGSKASTTSTTTSTTTSSSNNNGSSGKSPAQAPVVAAKSTPAPAPAPAPAPTPAPTKAQPTPPPKQAPAPTPTPAPQSATNSKATTPTPTPTPAITPAKPPAPAPTPTRAPPPQVTVVPPSQASSRAAPRCAPGTSPRTYAASSTRMCVLEKATANEGMVWNAIGQQVSYSQAQSCWVASCPPGLEPIIPGRGANGGIVTTQSNAKATGGVGSAAAAEGPTTIIVEQAGRRLAAVQDVAALDQDVFVVMQFAASCYTLCEPA